MSSATNVSRLPTAKWFISISIASVCVCILALVLKIIEAFALRRPGIFGPTREGYLTNFLISPIIEGVLASFIYHAATFFVVRRWQHGKGPSTSGASFIPREYSRSGLAGAYIMAIVWLPVIAIEAILVRAGDYLQPTPTPAGDIVLVLAAMECGLLWYIAAKSTIERKKLLRMSRLGTSGPGGESVRMDDF